VHVRGRLSFWYTFGFGALYVGNLKTLLVLDFQNGGDLRLDLVFALFCDALRIVLRYDVVVLWVDILLKHLVFDRIDKLIAAVTADFVSLQHAPRLDIVATSHHVVLGVPILENFPSFFLDLGAHNRRFTLFGIRTQLLVSHLSAIRRHI
jgi:hypothetical protein